MCSWLCTLHNAGLGSDGRDLIGGHGFIVSSFRRHCFGGWWVCSQREANLGSDGRDLVGGVIVSSFLAGGGGYVGGGGGGFRKCGRYVLVS